MSTNSHTDVSIRNLSNATNFQVITPYKSIQQQINKNIMVTTKQMNKYGEYKIAL